MDHFEFMELLRDLYEKHAVNHYEKDFPLPPKTNVRVDSNHKTEDGIKWGITCLKTIAAYKKLASYRGVKFHALHMIAGHNHYSFLTYVTA